MTDIDDARVRWLSERAKYKAFGELLARRVRVAVKAAGIWAEITSREKDTHSLVKKLLKKSHHTYESLPDKVGVRCMVRYLATNKQTPLA